MLEDVLIEVVFPPRKSRRVLMVLAVVTGVLVFVAIVFFGLQMVLGPSGLHLIIKTDFSGAHIHVDGQIQLGKTPLTIKGF